MASATFEDHPTDPDKMILRKPRLDQGPDYERGFVDGMQKQMQSSVDKAVNRMAQPMQEPVAFINVEKRSLEWVKPISWHTPTTVNLPNIPLYTTPLQRTWVGLTDREFEEVTHGMEDLEDCWIAIEAKLKDKNNA
jgi:hypothetical protein